MIFYDAGERKCWGGGQGITNQPIKMAERVNKKQKKKRNCK